eukprot:m.23775 g.23775  ORF g.23775 m.23775 type:complete len:119 (-) comp11427_c0_seq3:199-555(-)
MSLLQRASCTIAPRVPHLVALRHAGQNVRLGRGQSKNGTTYGALTDGPDWTHLETAIPAPETQAQRRRRLKQERQQARIALLLSEMTVGIDAESSTTASTTTSTNLEGESKEADADKA